MTFEECILKEFGLDVSDRAIYSVPTYKKVWDAARPKPLTDDEIRKCWRACGGSAPMAFAREIQKKLGVTDE